MDRSGWVCLLDRDILNDVTIGDRYSLSWKFKLCSNRDILSEGITDGDILGDEATKFYQTVLDLTRVSNEK